MGIVAACQCGARFMAEDRLAGQNVRCPTCGNSFEVPRPETPTAPQSRKSRFRFRWFYVVLGVSALVVLWGLSSSFSGDDAPVFATPEEAYAALRHASAQQDWGAAFDTTTSESQEALAGMCVIFVAINPLQDPEVAAFARRYRIDAAKLATEQKLPLSDRSSILSIGSTALRDAGKVVSDGCSFFIDAMPILNQAAMSTKNSSGKRLTHPLTSEYLVELGSIRYRMGGQIADGLVGWRPLSFRKIDERKWLVHFFER